MESINKQFYFILLSYMCGLLVQKYSFRKFLTVRPYLFRVDILIYNKDWPGIAQQFFFSFCFSFLFTFASIFQINLSSVWWKSFHCHFENKNTSESEPRKKTEDLYRVMRRILLYFFSYFFWYVDKFLSFRLIQTVSCGMVYVCWML